MATSDPTSYATLAGSLTAKQIRWLKSKCRLTDASAIRWLKSKYNFFATKLADKAR